MNYCPDITYTAASAAANTMRFVTLPLSLCRSSEGHSGVHPFVTEIWCTYSFRGYSFWDSFYGWMQKKKEEKINPDIASFGYRMDFGASVTAGVLLFAVFFSFAVLILSQSLFCRSQERPSSLDPGKGSEKEKQIPPYPFSSFGFDGVQSANFSSLLALHFGKQCRWRGKVIASGWLCNNIVTFLLIWVRKKTCFKFYYCCWMTLMIILVFTR